MASVVVHLSEQAHLCFLHPRVERTADVQGSALLGVLWCLPIQAVRRVEAQTLSGCLLADGTGRDGTGRGSG